MFFRQTGRLVRAGGAAEAEELGESLRVSHRVEERQSGLQKYRAVVECAKRAYNFVSSPRGSFSVR